MTRTTKWRLMIRQRFALMVLVGLIEMVLSSSEATAQTVISKARIGGYAEDITFVASGPLKDHIVMIDGFDVVAAPVKKPKDPLRTVFSLKIPELDVLPTGLTYIESEGLFAFASDTNFKKLFLFDSGGAFVGTRNIQYLNSAYSPQHFEGMAYIPSSSPTFPDHLIVVVWDDLVGGTARLEIMRRDGVVVSEVFRPDWPSSFFESVLGDVAYLAPNRLLVTPYGAGIWTMDFSGNILSGPVTMSDGVGEGIVQMSDNRIVATDYPQSLLFFDSNLNRAPASDRNDIIGLNLNTPGGVTWNPDTNQLLVTHDMLSSTTPAISSVPTSLDSATTVVNSSGFRSGNRLTYLPAEHLIAMTHGNPRAIVLFNSNGTFNSQIALSAAALGQNLGAPAGIAYIPTTNEFALAFQGAANDPNRAVVRRTLYVLSRGGALVRTHDLTGTGAGAIGGLDYYVDPAGNERFIILASSGRVIITDLNGNSRNASGFVIFEFNSRVKLGLPARVDITAITTGPLAGAFAIIENRGGEIVIFRLD